MTKPTCLIMVRNGTWAGPGLYGKRGFGDFMIATSNDDGRYGTQGWISIRKREVHGPDKEVPNA